MHIGVDTLAVVVEHHKQVGVRRTGIVESLKSQSARHSTVANDSHNTPLPARHLGGLGQTIGCRN